jgi:hypothetical protein
MRKIAIALTLVAGVAVLVFAENAWNLGILGKIHTATDGQAVTTVTLPPAPTLIPLTQDPSSASPTPDTPSAIPTLTPLVEAPAATATPAATPAPPSGPWSAADCAWATTTLTEDQTLDQGTATAESSSYYQTWANRWGSELYYVVTPVCTTTTQPTYNAVVDFIVWNGCAQATHLADGNPNDAAWNALWASNYARLNSMAFSLESSYGWPPTDAGTGPLDC